MPALDPSAYAAVFESTPVALLVFTPDLTMVDANQKYLDAVGMQRSDIVGRSVFDVFPNSPDREGVDQVAALHEVMQRAAAGPDPQVLVQYRYDIPSPAGGFETRFWDVTEVPVHGPDGSVQYVLHYTEDRTELVREREARERVAATNQQLEGRVAEAQAALLARAQELEVLNARLRRMSEHDRDVAQTLQRALLTRLPQRDPLLLAARYETAGRAEQVGGDWYDAVPLPHGGTALMIGDVVGHDINAAAMMGQLRSMLRAFAWDREKPPSAIMTQLDRAIRDLDLGTRATAILANIEGDAAGTPGGARTLRWTNAGHPPPLLLRPDGTVDTLGDDGDDNDVLLGVVPDEPRRDHTVTLETGSTLLLYTDGLVEHRAETIDAGIDRLRAALSGRQHMSVDELVSGVVEDIVGPEPSDDTAVLGVRLTGSDEPVAVSSGVA